MTTMSQILTLDGLISLCTLTAMEIVLGVDNIIFIAIMISKLPTTKRELARKLGVGLALFLRIALLLSISWIMSLTEPLFTMFNQAFSGRSLILLGGGLFLMAKATFEIHDKLEESVSPTGQDHSQKMVQSSDQGAVGFLYVLVQILLLDIIFSLDSVITAVGMVQHIPIMITAMVLSVFVMLWASKAVGDFVMAHPTIKILALSFLILIGFTLIMEGLGTHVAKGYIYFAMAYALAIEMINMKVRKKHA